MPHHTALQGGGEGGGGGDENKRRVVVFVQDSKHQEVQAGDRQGCMQQKTNHSGTHDTYAHTLPIFLLQLLGELGRTSSTLMRLCTCDISQRSHELEVGAL